MPVNSKLITTNQTVATRQHGNFGALGNFAHLTLSVILPGLDVVISLDYIYIRSAKISSIYHLTHIVVVLYVQYTFAHLQPCVVEHEFLLLFEVRIHGFRQNEPHGGVVTADTKTSYERVYIQAVVK